MQQEAKLDRGFQILAMLQSSERVPWEHSQGALIRVLTMNDPIVGAERDKGKINLSPSLFLYDGQLVYIYKSKISQRL